MRKQRLHLLVGVAALSVAFAGAAAFPSLAAAEEAVLEEDVRLTAEDAEFGEDDVAERAWTVVTDPRMEEPDRGELSAEEVQALMEAMSAALAAEEAGDFEEAREQFVIAYELFPHSNILLSVARVSAQLDELETATKGYRQFLERQPDYETREEIERRIVQMEEELQEREALAEDDEGEAIDWEVIASNVEAVMPPSTIGWAGLGVTVVGLGSMIGGAAVASSVRRDFETLAEARSSGDRRRYISLSDDIASKQTRGRVFLYGGMLLTAAGAGLLTYDYVFSNPGEAQSAEPGARLYVDPQGTEAVFLRWQLTF